MCWLLRIPMSRVSSGDWGSNDQMTDPYYINELHSDLRGVKEGWYAIDETNAAISYRARFNNRELCLTRISQAVNWAAYKHQRIAP